ncbi:MAG TPA: ABC transporter ATP-binding protein [Anaerolineales bacterium]|nr:ABC transporter ATP-binding protein [Anaerolineales bacterium]
MSDFLEARSVQKSFGGVQAVAGVDLTIRRGEIFALIGPNGAGKTTLFNLISGMYPMDRGHIRFEGHLIQGLRAHKIAASGLVRTFQNLQIFSSMTVLENVLVGCHLHTHTGFVAAALRLSSVAAEERRARAEARLYLEMVGLAARADDIATSLPYGQQRLLEIARALAAHPKLLMLDEPAAGLTRPETESLDALICRIRESGITVLLVEHDMNLVMGIADRVAVLHYGRKIAEGTPAEVQANEQVVGAYLGMDWGIEFGGAGELNELQAGKEIVAHA